jgi:two-component system response regulator LytT
MKNKFAALIVEDDPVAEAELTLFLGRTNMFEKPTVYASVMESYSHLIGQTVDILFLDLELRDFSGLELLRLIENPPPVIITSSHVQLAIDCFEFDVADFLSKPYSYTRLLRGIHRAIQKQPSTHTSGEDVSSKKHIFLQTGRASERFELNDILYIEAYGIYVKVITKSGVSVVNQMLSSIEKDLPATSFLRIHRSFLINLEHLNRIEPNDLWVGSFQIPIGLSHKDKVRQTLKNNGIID